MIKISDDRDFLLDQRQARKSSSGHGTGKTARAGSSEET